MVAVVMTVRHQRLRGAVTCAFVLVLAGCSRAPQVTQLPPPEVGVRAPVERDVTEFFETTGRTTAVDAVDIRARVSGYLVKIGFKDGDEVQPGDVLFEIDPRPFEAQRLQAEGELARWEAQRKKAESDLARNQRLMPTGAASQKELDAAIAAKGTADAEIMSARGRLDQAKLNREFATVTAPVKGRVSKANVTIGNLVEVSTLLTNVVSLEPMWMYFDIDERTVLQYRERYRAAHADSPNIPNARALTVPIEIGLANEDGFSRRGVIDFVDNQVDAGTGTMLARGAFENADHSLTPGLFVRVRLPIGNPTRSLLVSERAVGTDQGNKYLLIVNPNNVVEYRAVKLGPISDGLRVIREGLRPGERVITAGIQRVRPGITVAPQEAAPSPDTTATPAPASAS